MCPFAATYPALGYLKKWTYFPGLLVITKSGWKKVHWQPLVAKFGYVDIVLLLVVSPFSLVELWSTWAWSQEMESNKGVSKVKKYINLFFFKFGNFFTMGLSPIYFYESLFVLKWVNIWLKPRGHKVGHT